MQTAYVRREPATLIVPGLDGSPEGHWQRWWLDDHESALLVEQADWSRPDLDSWLARLEFELMANGPSILVAHSLGAVLVASLPGRLSAGNVIGALLVAPCDLDRANRLHNRRVGFPGMPRERLPFPSILVASEDDPYMNYGAARHFAATWGSGLVNLGKAGHINIASGHGRWLDAYAMVETFSAHNNEVGVFSTSARRTTPINHFGPQTRQ